MNKFIGSLLTTMLLTSASINLFAQAWIGDLWQYRREITISNPGAAVLTDYQVKINLDDTNFEFQNAKPDGSDIRITANDGLTFLPYWIESWNQSAEQATIWMKVPSLPSNGTTVFIYYGHPSPSIPSLDPVETPPIGPYTRAPGNPIIPFGATGSSLLAENMVYDPVTNHYWMCLANYSQSTIALCYSDTPENPDSWIWGGNVISSFDIFYSGAPHLILYDNTWYLFYADRPNIRVATASSVAGPYTINPTPILQPSSPTGAWDSFRVDEPYIFQRSDGKWILIYMGDAGGVTEQVGYAVADNITGPYTAYAQNPILKFGEPGTFDAGTIADPWVYVFDNIFYIGYTVSSTKNSPWQTALATTSDWITFTKHGVILPASGTAFDNANSFRGAVTRIGDTYVFSYTGGGYGMGLATQPVFMAPENIYNNYDAVFDFYDTFDGIELNPVKWTIVNGYSTQTSVSGGLLTLTSPSDADYIRIFANNTYSMNYIIESRASHPDQGTQDLIAEVGFADAGWNAAVRIVDDFKLGTTYWQRQARNTASPDDFIDMAQTADPNWHIFRVFRHGINTAGFQIDNNPIETTNVNVPTISLSPFLMSYGAGNDFVIDWIRVRKYELIEPVTSVGFEQANPLPVELSTFSAVIIGSTVKLNWQTETEINNFGFEVERTSPQPSPYEGESGEAGRGWEKIGFVNGNGYSNTPRLYNFNDDGLMPGKYLYRLKQIDNDGQFEYSKTVEVDFNSPKKFELSQNYPNPFNPSTSIKYSISSKQFVMLKVYDVLGKEVAILVNENKEAGSYSVNFIASKLPSGVYIYKMQAGDFVQTRKMTLIQ